MLSAPGIPSSTGVVASTTLNPAPKKSRKTPSSSKTSSSSVPAIASGGGGGAVVSSVSSVSSGISASAPPLSGKKLCLHHLKHLFLGGAVCTRGQQCKFVHQRGVKSTRKVDLIDFVEDVAKNDAQLIQLVAAINLKA